jgi:hypothetical protein
MLLGACSFAALPIFAQDYQEGDDMTDRIVNPSFDEDITFTSDGQPKADITNLEEKAKMSERSWNWMTADSTLYARAITADEGNGTWSRSTDSYAYNGFLGRIKGWTLTTGNRTSCEWVYFGSFPYDLGETAVPIADNGDTWLTVPTEKPEEANTEDNKGALFLRAGWGGYAIYSQQVSLPCAQYKLTFWAINTNAEGSKSNTKYKNLCKVICRDAVAEDNQSFAEGTWTKHEIEFTATSDFTIQFGYQSDGGSGTNPFLWIDDIRLTYVEAATEEQLLQEDLTVLSDSIAKIVEGELDSYEGLYDEVNLKYQYFQDLTGEDDVDVLKKAIAEAKEYIKTLNETILANVKTLQALVDAGVNAAEKGYPGIATFSKAVTDAKNALAKGTSSEIAAQIDALNEATRAYYISQEAPADFTFLVSSPEFCISTAVPTYSDGVAEYPNVADYTAGTAPSDATSEGWNKGTVTSGDQRLNYAQGRICWNLWDSGKAGYHEVYQELKDIAIGKYTVSGELITQSGCVADQLM